MSLLKVYGRIEDVLRMAGRPLAAHEFCEVRILWDKYGPILPMSGRSYINCTEATLSRRMRELAAMGRLTAKTREGKTFKEYEIAKKPVPEGFSITTCGLGWMGVGRCANYPECEHQADV